MKRILIIGNANSSYIHGLICGMKKVKLETKIDIWTTFAVKSKPDVNKLYEPSIFFWYSSLKEKFKDRKVLLWLYTKSLRFKIPIHTITFIAKMIFRKKYYDTVQVHIPKPYLLLPIMKCLLRISNRIVLVFWGSDLMRMDTERSISFIKVIEQAQNVCSLTKSLDSILEKLVNQIGIKINKQIIGFGLSLLDTMKNYSNLKRSELLDILNLNNINKLTRVIVIGHYGDSAQQHLDILDSLAQFNFDNVYYILPMTYGLSDDSYLFSVRDKLNELGVKYTIFDKYMNIEQVAALRLLSDIFIQMLKTDALSGAMQEHLYGGSIVITGDWLDYSQLSDLDIYFRSIKDVASVGEEVKVVLDKFDSEKEKCNNNSKKIWNRASWEYFAKKWIEL